jgi:cobalt/nickel transport system ATP-binding protein
VGLAPADAERKARACLASVGLAGYELRVPHHLSFGEKKRVAIAAALALDPEVLLLDEPTAGLDPKSASELLDVLFELKDRKKTILTTTHDLHLATELCDRVLVVSKGTIAAQGQPDRLLSDRALLEEHNLVHRHRHRHKGRGLPVVGQEEHGHAHDHLHDHHHESGHDHP